MNCRNCNRGAHPYITAYEIAKKYGYKGTEKQWINSLQTVYLAHVTDEGTETWECDNTFEKLYELSEVVEVHLITLDGRTAFPSYRSDTLLVYRTPTYEAGTATVYELYQLTPTGSRRYVIDVDEQEAGSIAKSRLALDVQASLDKADTAYQEPDGGIPLTDLDASAQAEIALAGTAIQPTDATIEVHMAYSNGAVVTDKSWEYISDKLGHQQKVDFIYGNLIMHLQGVNWANGHIALFSELNGTVVNVELDPSGDIMVGTHSGVPIYVKPDTGIPLTDLEETVQRKIQKADFRSIVFTVSNDVYSFYGADFEFSNVDDVISKISDGANIRIVILNTNDTYPAVHFQGAESLARVYFAGPTVWSSPNYGVAIDAFELRDAGQSVALTRVYHEPI